MSHFVNDPSSVVAHALDGLIRASGGRLVRLDGFPDVKVVLRSDRPAGRVAVLSGGGAGHEPTHAGFVGSGLLTAAVSGEIFASPGTEAVLAAIRAADSGAGTVLVVKNYTGDRLNFGLAVERARRLGLDVDMVVVSDDIALRGIAQPRGIAGTLFVHKVAGAAAEAGADLREVTDLGRRVAASVRTLGVSVSGVEVPFRAPARGIDDGLVEIGLGIHGEPGRELAALGAVSDLVSRMVGELDERLPRDRPLAALVNNLGGVSALEMAIVTGELLSGILGPRIELLVGPAALMTSLGMRGFSISLLPLEPEIRGALLATSDPWAAWPGCSRVGSVTTEPLPTALTSQAGYTPSVNADVRELIEQACLAIEAARERLDILDARIGDGDTGSTFASAAVRIRGALDSLPLAAPADLCACLSELVSASMGASSGVLLSILLATMSRSLAAEKSVGGAFADGVAAMRNYGGAAQGDRTMLDALIPASQVLQRGGPLVEAAAAARAGADSTAALAAARAGRASYLGAAHLEGVVDPGAEAVSIVLESLATPPGVG